MNAPHIYSYKSVFQQYVHRILNVCVKEKLESRTAPLLCQNMARHFPSNTQSLLKRRQAVARNMQKHTRKHTNRLLSFSCDSFSFTHRLYWLSCMMQHNERKLIIMEIGSHVESRFLCVFVCLRVCVGVCMMACKGHTEIGNSLLW